MKKRTKDEVMCSHCGASFSRPALVKHHDKAPCGECLVGADLRVFTHYVDMTTKVTKAQQKVRERSMVVSTIDGRTALKLRETETAVTYIPYSIAGLTVDRMAPATFKSQYRDVPNYPTPRCATLYLQFAQDVGATGEAMEEISKLIDIPPKMRAGILEQLESNKATKDVVKSVKAGKHGNVKVQKKQKSRETAASMFRGLILEGALTDDEIFAKVQDEFGLSENKRSYVNYYRRELQKKGEAAPSIAEATSAARKKARKKKSKKAVKKPMKKVKRK